MEIPEREKKINEVTQIADAVKEFELKRLALEKEQQPLLQEYQELEYKHLTEIESAADARSRALYANENRKIMELQHRLRRDQKAKELTEKFTGMQSELERIQVELNHLKDKRLSALSAIGLVRSPEPAKDENAGQSQS